jgi:Spy/CpxP family protein refolding chaperone
MTVYLCPADGCTPVLAGAHHIHVEKGATSRDYVHRAATQFGETWVSLWTSPYHGMIYLRRMTMYRRLLTIAASGLLILGVALCGNAQEAGPPPGQHPSQGHRMSADEELQRMDKALKLTDDQKNQIKPILEDRRQKMESLRSDTSMSVEDRHNKMRSIFQDSNNKIRDVLNEDQRKKYDDMLQHARERMQGHGHEHESGGGTAPANPQ